MTPNQKYKLITWGMWLAFIVAIAFVFSPRTSRAATVQVYPEATYTHGGQVFPKDMSSIFTADNGTQQGGGVERYTFPGGAYSVQYNAPAGYRAVLGDGCSGTLSADQDVTCHVSVVDGAPIEAPQPAPAAPPAPPAPAPAPTQGPAPSGGAVAIPAPNPAPVATDTPIGAIATSVPTIIIQTIIKEVPATTTNYIEQPATTTDATTTKQIADLQQRVGVLERIVNAIVAFLRSIFGF